MAKQKFETTILTAGKTATGIRVPDDISLNFFTELMRNYQFPKRPA